MPTICYSEARARNTKAITTKRPNDVRTPRVCKRQPSSIPRKCILFYCDRGKHARSARCCLGYLRCRLCRKDDRAARLRYNRY